MKPKKTNKNLKSLSKKLQVLWQTRLTRQIIIGIGGFLVIIAALFFSFNLAYQDKILPRTFIGGTNFGGMTRANAQETLTRLTTHSTNQELTFSFEGKDYPLGVTDLGINYSNSYEKTLDDLFRIGRTGNLGKILKEIAKSVFSRNQALASFTLNDQKLNTYLGDLSKNINIEEKDATIVVKDSSVSVVGETVGRKFAEGKNKNLILTTIGGFTFGSLPLVVEEVKPKINSATAQKAVEKTSELLSHVLMLKAKDKSYDITSTDIASMIEFVARLENKISNDYYLSPEISVAKVNPVIEKIANEIYQEPKDAKFKIENGKVAAFQISQTGYELDRVKAVTQVIEAIEENEKVVELEVKVTEPEISSSDPVQGGITELVAEGMTSWKGSPKNRIHNLSLGAEKISGTIVKPGQEFSTVHALSPITAASGFLPELVIKGGNRVEPDIGGGLCQVSTTLFRAVLNSGLKVTARTAHSFRVPYYEPPVGMDATIFDPKPDFKFVNDMDTPILIWAFAGNNSLTFQIYGTKDNRKVEITEPVVGDYISPSGAIYSESASMGAGEIRQVERATPGATASFHYKVTKSDGSVTQDETFVSKYVAVPDSFLYGPGTPDIPQPAPEEPNQ